MAKRNDPADIVLDIVKIILILLIAGITIKLLSGI